MSARTTTPTVTAAEIGGLWPQVLRPHRRQLVCRLDCPHPSHDETDDEVES